MSNRIDSHLERRGRKVARQSRTFRIFVSSTFSDLVAERNALQERVWPKLRDLCMSHGCRFQAIDLRWGVSEEAALDQQTMNICLREIRRCREVTPRPNFVVLLGQRYGWQPIPPQIEGGEFERLLVAMTESNRERLCSWYRLDTNAVPAEYVLQPREPGGPFEDADAWADEEHMLHGILLNAAREAGLPAQETIKYERSATEQEIREGALTAQTDHAFCYFRTIQGVPNGESGERFAEADPDAHRLHQQLKHELRRHFPADQVHDLRASWAGKGPSEDHLDELCACVEADLSTAIIEEIGRIESQDDLDAEIEAHEAFAAERRRHFIGRQEALARIREYIDGDARHPLVIYGPGGSGKSALMAKAVEECRRGDHVFIHRLIGATPDSTDIRSLLESLCRQTGREYGKDDDPPTEYQELLEELPKRLALATAENPLGLFLDALDQLSPTDNAHTLNWLPAEVPENVRIVASVLEREDEEHAGYCLRSARTRFPAEGLVQLSPLTSHDGATILDAWLTEAGRTLTPEQRADVLGKFAREGLPLYLKVAFEEARRWYSYDGLPCGADEVPGLFETVDGVIRDMLSRLEDPRNHGNVLVSKALGYLAAARHGLTEDELLDVLSADEEVKQDFQSRSRYWPEAERLPVVLWSRLHFDLAPYLIERSADRTSLLAFYHRQLQEVVGDLYVAGQQRQSLHERMGSYFLRSAGMRYRAGDTDAHAFVEAPYHLYHAGRQDALVELLRDVRYLDGRCASRDIYGLLADFGLVAKERFDEIRERQKFLLRHAGALLRHPLCLLSTLWREGPSDWRADAADLLDRGEWRRGWIRTDATWSQPTDEAQGTVEAVEVRTRHEYEFSCTGAIAAERQTAFCMRKLGDIRAIDLTRGAELPGVIPCRALRPLAATCSADGRFLALAFDTGEIDVLCVTYSPEGAVKIVETAQTLSYALPEFEDPVLGFVGENLCYQKASGAVALLAPRPDSSEREVVKPADPPAELSGLADSGESTFFAFRFPNGTRIVMSATDAVKTVLERNGADVAAMSAGGDGRLAIAYTDGSLEGWHGPPGTGTCETTHWKEAPVAMTWAADRLLWVDDRGALYTWQQGCDLASEETAGSTLSRGDSVGLFLGCHDLQCLADGEFAAVGARSAIRFAIETQQTMGGGEVLAVLDPRVAGTQGHYSFRLRGGDLDLVDGLRHVVHVVRAAWGRDCTFALDGSGWLLAIGRAGPALQADPKSLEILPIEVPHGASDVAGAVPGGFWLMFDTGDIRFLTREGCSHPIVRSEMLMIGNPRLWSWPGLLVWSCLSNAWTEHGQAMVYRAGFARTKDEPLADLSVLGTREFSIGDGTLQFAAYDPVSDRVCLFWQAGTPHWQAVSYGAPAEFLGHNEKREPLRNMGGGLSDGAATPDGRHVYVRNAVGDLLCLDTRSWDVVAALSGSAPLTSISLTGCAPDGSLLAVEAGVRVLRCSYREAGQ